MKWDDVKQLGSSHYKTGGVEPIDLYRSGGILRDFAIGSIIKYAYRNRRDMWDYVRPEDMDKIIHFANILKSMAMGMNNDLKTDIVPDAQNTGEEE
jgi:hypothetical protein